MTELLILRLVHVLAGTFWVGAGVFSVFFLTPVLMRAGPAAGPVMAGLQARKLFTALPTAALLTIGSGVRLMMIASDGFGAAWFATAPGKAFTASGIAATVAFLLAMFWVRPMSVRAMQLSGEAPATPDDGDRARMLSQAAALRGRAGFVGNLVVGLLVFGAAGMSVARYLT